MSVNYKLVQKKNPQKKSEPAKWYATPNSAKPLAQKVMTRVATENTTTAPIELESAMELLAAFIPQQLQQGHTVNVPGLGSFRLSFKSDGVEKVDDFRPEKMIKSPRVVFTPSKELKERTLRGLSYEEGGVLENKVSYASLADYRKAKGLPTPAPGGSGSGTGGGTSGGSGEQGENPLG